MKIVSREKSENYGWSYLSRCKNEECDIVLELNPSDIFAVEVGYDSEFHSYDYNYCFRCPECGKLNNISGWYLPKEIKQLSEINRDPGFKKKEKVKVKVNKKKR